MKLLALYVLTVTAALYVLLIASAVTSHADTLTVTLTVPRADRDDGFHMGGPPRYRQTRGYHFTQAEKAQIRRDAAAACRMPSADERRIALWAKRHPHTARLLWDRYYLLHGACPLPRP